MVGARRKTVSFTVFAFVTAFALLSLLGSEIEK
jgi:uncharacterized membrane protein